MRWLVPEDLDDIGHKVWCSVCGDYLEVGDILDRLSPYHLEYSRHKKCNAEFKTKRKTINDKTYDEMDPRWTEEDKKVMDMIQKRLETHQ